MRAITIMYDSLNRLFLPNYGDMETIAPNFKRLSDKMVTFDQFYVGSLPWHPARRELHTGSYNFMHRCWGPLDLLTIPHRRSWPRTASTPTWSPTTPTIGRTAVRPSTTGSPPTR